MLLSCEGKRDFSVVVESTGMGLIPALALYFTCMGPWTICLSSEPVFPIHSIEIKISSQSAYDFFMGSVATNVCKDSSML
jgi:hypothetical protein